MSFKAWFKQWRRSLYRLFMLGNKPYKSDRQRKKEHERYVKSKSSHIGRYRVSEKKKCRRHGGNYKILSALMGFMASTLSIVLLPFGLLHLGYKSVKKKNGTRKSAHKFAPRSNAKPKQSNFVQNKTVTNNTKTASSHKTSAQRPCTEDKKEPSVAVSLVAYEAMPPNAVSNEPEQINNDSDENTPKSAPKSERDQYIRKRMIIAGSSYCDKEILARLEIGSYLDVVAEPDNPYDKDAVKLLYDGKKIGYISKKDKLPFVACLKLGRKVYGVITNVLDDEFPTKYEFETWLERR